MSETNQNQSEKKTPKENKGSPSTTAIIVAFAAIFIVLGFLILTKDQRDSGEDQAEESKLENKVDAVDVEEKEDMEDAEVDMLDDEDEDEDVLGAEDAESAEEYFADLYIHEYTLSEEEPMQNEEITVHIEIVNSGDADSEEFHWEWWAETNELGCDGDIDWLDIDEKETVECEYTYDDYGNFETRVVIDTDDDVDEVDEYNNLEERDIDVFEEEFVDLVVYGYSFDRSAFKKDEPMEVTIGIRNEGNIAAGEFTWLWMPTWALDVCEATISGLAPNIDKEVICSYTYEGCYGAYDTAAVIDVYDDVEETDEENNEYHEDISVSCF